MTLAAPPPLADRPRRGVDVAFWMTAAVLGVVLVGGKLLMHASAHTTDLDTGNYSNYAWGILHGQGFFGSVLGRHHLGEHFSPIMVFVAPLYLIRPTAYWLMILQGLAVTAGVMLTLAFANRRMEEAGFDEALIGRPAVRAKVMVNGLLLVLMAFYLPLLATWNTQFQAIELGFPLVIAALMLLHAPATRANHVLLGVVVVLLLMTRESAPLSVMGLAIYAAGARRRWRTAAVLLVVAFAWLWMAMRVIMPYFRDGGRWGHVRWQGRWEMWDLKRFYLLAMVGGLGLLPLVGRPALWATLAAVPGILLNLEVRRVQQLTFQGHYDAQTCAFLLVAAVHGAVWLARHLIGPSDPALPAASGAGDAHGAGARTARAPRWPLAALCGAVAVGTSVAIWVYRQAQDDAGNTSLVVERLVSWWPTYEQRRLINQSKRFAREYGADAPSMAAHGSIGPHVAHRLNYRSMRVADAERWPGWVMDRVDPGMIFLVPGETYRKRDGARQILRDSGHAELLEQTPWVEVYRWPLDAPPRLSPAAEEYAKQGLSKAARASK